MKKSILFFGKIPPPYIGPAVATKKILNSRLSEYFEIIHFDISHQKNFNQLGKLGLSNFIYPFIFYYRLLIILYKKDPDIVYIPSQQSTLTFLRDIPLFIITKIYGKKLVCHLRGGYFLKWYNESNFLTKWVICRAQKLIDAQIVLGHNLIDLYKPFMDIDKIFVVPNGGSFDYPDKKTKENKIINILFLGNFIRSKGIIDFIKAGINLPPEYYEKIVLQIAGNHVDSKEEIEGLLNSKLDISLNNLGPITGEDKNAILINADIFVFPTFYRNEGHPWVIVEALAAGLPIISTNRGAIIESVIDGYNGFIIEPNSPKEIIEKILKLVDDKNLRNQMGKNSKKIYKEKFTEKILVKKFSYVFNKILEY